MNKTPVVIGSSLSAIASSFIAMCTAFCCVGPAIVAVLGTSESIAAARLEPYRLYLIAGSVLLLGLGFWLAYRPQGGCIGKTCITAAAKTARMLLWLGVILTGGAIFLPNFVRG